MNTAPHYPKCNCYACKEWRMEVRAEHDRRDRDRDRSFIVRVPAGFLDSLAPSPVFEHDLEPA